MKSLLNPFKNKLNIKESPHRCLEFDISKFSISEKEAISQLNNNNLYETYIKDIDTQSYKSIKLILSPNEGRFLKNLIDNSFYIHHTWENNLILYKWIHHGLNKVPSYPFTNIGIGNCILTNTNKFILVQERSKENDYGTKGNQKWKFVTGHLEVKETIKQGSLRENHEELGISYEKMEFIGNLYMRHLNLNRIVDYCFFNMIYIKDDFTQEDFSFSDEEILKARLFSCNELKEMIMNEEEDDEKLTKATKMVLKRVIEYVNPNESSVENIEKIRKDVNRIVDEDVDEKYLFGMSPLRY